MNPKVKLTAYGVLVVLAIFFAWKFYANYTVVNQAAARQAQAAAAADDTSTGGSQAATTAPTDTNAPAATNLAVATNSATNVAAADSTNAAAAVTNAAGATNVASAATNSPTKASATQAAAPTNVAASRGAMIGYLGALVASVIGLGLLVAFDVTNYMGQQTVDFLFNDDGDGVKDPEYERAEQVWANGKHLEAIELMREYLKKNPRELHAALRIAEIYEKDLHNYLAAALEYEEVIKHKLPAERWGWAAIHLCNLYSRLGQPEKTLKLLRRIVDEYPQTAAAKKARTRLGMSEDETGAGVVPVETEAEVHPAPEPAPQEPEPPSNLPPGFRPK